MGFSCKLQSFLTLDASPTISKPYFSQGITDTSPFLTRDSSSTIKTLSILMGLHLRWNFYRYVSPKSFVAFNTEFILITIMCFQHLAYILQPDPETILI